jgi:hypothetical protein
MSNTPVGFCAAPDCGKPIWAGQPNVYLAMVPGKRRKPGSMHTECWRAWQASAVQPQIDKAVAEGRHTLKPSKTVCEGCGRWVDAIFHKGTQDGKRYCLKCAHEQGLCTKTGKPVGTEIEFDAGVE